MRDSTLLTRAHSPPAEQATPSWISGSRPSARSWATIRARTAAAAGEPTGWGAPSPSRSRSTACDRPAETSAAGAEAGLPGGGPPRSTVSTIARTHSARATPSPHPAARSPGSTALLDSIGSAILTSVRGACRRRHPHEYDPPRRILEQFQGAAGARLRDVRGPRDLRGLWKIDARPPPPLPSRIMAPAAEDLLFGRIALHYKLVTREQLLAVAQAQARDGDRRRLGEILLAQGLLTPRQVEQILAVQRDYAAKQGQAGGAASPLAHSTAPLTPQAMP